MKVRKMKEREKCSEFTTYGIGPLSALRLPCTKARCSGFESDWSRADKGRAVKRARPSKKVRCSGLGLRLEMSLVFDFGQGLRCGLYIRHCRCH